MIYASIYGCLDLKALSLKDELESSEINKIIDCVKSLMNRAPDRNTINKDNYVFYFNELLTSRGIKIQNDVLTKEQLIANVVNYRGSITMGIGLLFFIHDCLKPDPTVKTAARVATQASHLINRTGSLIIMGHSEDLDHEHKYHESSFVSHFRSSPLLGGIQEDYFDEQTKTLNRKGLTVLSDA